MLHIGGTMVKHDCIIVISYNDEMTFEEVTATERNLLQCIESSFNRCSPSAYSHESTENSCLIRCELTGILPLHFIRDMAKDIVAHLPDNVECRILVYSSNLAVIKGAVCKQDAYTLQSLDAIQSIGNRRTHLLYEEKLNEQEIFS